MTYNDKPINIIGCSDILCDFEREFIPSMNIQAILPESTFNLVC